MPLSQRLVLMKLIFGGWFASLCLLAGVVFTGCGSSSDGPLFLDNPHPRGATGKQHLLPPNGADMARFQVGNTVVVSFSGPVPLEPQEQTIKEDGTITLPLVGSIYAYGKTVGELQNEIHDDYVPKYYVRLNVSVKSGDRFFYAGGEIKGTGRQAYTDGLTVTKAIQAAGGLTDFANHKKVWLIRAITGKRIQVDYDKAIENPAKDPPVYPEDQINVDKHW